MAKSEQRSRRWGRLAMGMALTAWVSCAGESIRAAEGLSAIASAFSLPESAGEAVSQEEGNQGPLQKGIEYLESKRFGEARKLFQSIAEKEKDNHEAFFYLGKAYFLEEKFPASIQWLENAVQIQPRSSLYHYWLARANEAQFQNAGILNKLKYGKRFRDEILRAVELDGNNLDARFWLMTFFLTSPRGFGGDWDKALEQAEAIKKADLAYGHHALITAYVKAGKFDLAEKELLERIGNFPDRVEHKISLSWFYLDRKNYPRAIQNSLDIINSHPDAAVALFQIGRAAAESETQRELGKRSLSQYIADKAPTIRPDLEWAHFYLAAILAAEGDTEGARSEYSKALLIVPDFKSAAQALKKLPKERT